MMESEGPTTMDLDQAVDAVMDSLEEQPEAEQETTAESEEVDAEVTDETPDDETEEAEAQDAEEETAETDEELFFELDGEEVSLAQIKQWKSEGLMQADYTRKTQEAAELKREAEAERVQVNQTKQALESERAQLQSVLASLSIDGEQEPNWVQLAQTLPPQEYQAEQARWQAKQAQKSQVQQAYQAMQAQEREQLVQRELAALLQHKPEWANPEQHREALQAMTTVAGPYGFTPDEIASITDHRMLRALDRLAVLEAQAVDREAAKDAVSKRVVKAQKRVVPGAKSPKTDTQSKALKATRAKFNKSRSLDDAVDAVMASLNS